IRQYAQLSESVGRCDFLGEGTAIFCVSGNEGRAGVETGGSSRVEMSLQLSSAAPVKIGWDGRVRTSEWGNQNPLPYHLATSQCRWRTGAEAPAERHHNQSRLGGQWHVAMRATRAVEGLVLLPEGTLGACFSASPSHPNPALAGASIDSYNAPLPGAPQSRASGRKA